jgi:hypothetical protein
MSAILVARASTVTTAPGSADGYFTVASNAAFQYPGAIVAITKSDGSLPRQCIIINLSGTTKVGLQFFDGTRSPRYNKDSLAAYDTGSALIMEAQVVSVSDNEVGQLIAGANITLSPPAGVGTVTVSAADDPAVGYATIQTSGTPVTQRTVLNFASGLTAVDNPGSTRTDVTNDLITGIAGNQVITGSTAASGTIQIQSTSNVTKGKIFLGAAAGTDFTVDEVNHRVGVGLASPEATLDVNGAVAARGTGTIASAVDAVLMTFESGAVSNMVANSGRIEASRPGTFRSLYLRGSDIILHAAGVAAPYPLKVWGATGNTTLGVNTDVASSILRVLATKTVASGASAIWNGIDIPTATLTWSGNTGVTTATGVNLIAIAAPVFTAASAVATTIAATVKIDGPPTVSGSATITKALALWVGGSTALARFGNGTGDITIECSTTFSSGTGTTILSAANMGAGNRVSLGATSSLSVNPDGRVLINTTTSSNSFLRVLATATVASGASIVWDGGLDIPTSTLTLSGVTNVTTASGLNLVNFSQATYTAGSAIAVTNAATVTIIGAPIAAGSATITNPYAFWVQGGASRFDGNVGIGLTASAFPVSRLQVVTDSDTTAGAPSTWDGKFFTVGVGGATGGGVSISYNSSTNIGYIESLTPGTSYRVLSFNNGALNLSAGTQNTGVGVSASTTSTILNVGGTRTVATATSAVFDGIILSGGLTLTGNTAITTATGVNLVSIPAPAYNDGSAVTITHAATFYIAGAPVPGGAGPVTITNAYALWVDSGKVRWDGGVALGGGSTATMGTIGGSGPASAAQNQWLPVNIDGNARFIPVWA